MEPELQVGCGITQYNNNNNIYLLQLGCYPVAVVILHVNKHEIGYYKLSIFFKN